MLCTGMSGSAPSPLPSIPLQLAPPFVVFQT
jgi:hypothetical protein